MTEIKQNEEGKVKIVKINGLEVKLDKAMTAIIEKAKAQICKMNGKAFSDFNESERLYITEQAVKIALQVKDKEAVIRAEREKVAGVISNDLLITLNDLTGGNKACKKYILDKLGSNAYVKMRLVPKQAKIEISDGTVTVSEDMIDSIATISIDDFVEEFTEMKDNKTREASDMGIVGADALAKIDTDLPLLHETIIEKGELIAKYAYRMLADSLGYGVANVK